MTDSHDKQALQAEIERLRAELGKAQSRASELEDTRKAMLYLLEDLEQSRQLIERGKREWNAAFDALAQPVFLHDSDFHLLRVNRAYAERAGLDYADIIGRLYWEVFPRLDGPMPGCGQTVENNEQTDTHELSLNGTDYLSHAYAVRDDHGRYTHSIHILDDITERRRAEQQIRDLSRFPSENPNPVMRFSRDGALLYANGAGYALLEAVGVAERRTLPERWANAGNQAMRSGRHQVIEVEAGERVYSLTVKPVSEGGYVNLYGADITDSKRLALLGLESGIAVNMAEGVQLTRSSDGIIVYTNPAFDRMFGYAPNELPGQHVSVLNAPGEPSPEALAGAIITALKETGVWNGELLNRRRDGSTFWCRASVSAYEHPQHGPVWLAVHLDITEHKEMERMKDELIATVSHDLRTPLTSLRGFTELMLTREYPADKQRKFLGIIDSEARRLNRLVDTFLDIQRMEAGRQTYHFEALALGPMLHDIVETYSGSDERHTFRIEVVEGLPAVRADADRLRQVLENLLSNAEHFSPAGGEIVLAARPEPGFVAVSISDQGIGIPAEAMPKLFTKFFRVEQAETRGIPGTGLGLVIVKKVIEAHGGRVWVESDPGRGSTFYFTLPVIEACENVWPQNDGS